MRLAELLVKLDSESLVQLASHHLDVDESESAALMCVNLENVLRSPKHIRETIYNLQPPALHVFELLLDAEDWSIPIEGL